MNSKFFKKSTLITLMCIFLFACTSITLAGVTGKISGTIKDANTGEALPGVNVVLAGTTMGAATDVAGQYFIVNIPPGRYTVSASMMGYEILNKTEVIVSVDHTTPVDFELKETTIQGAEVTVVAEREIVPMDVSASQIVAEAPEIHAIPFVQDVLEFVNLQAGVEGDIIRGGGLDQTGFMMDGLMVVDNRANKPVMMVNLSAVKEVSIIKGGFNAEYGNIRSGLINVITKSGEESYHGSLDMRLSPAHLKHSGQSLFDHNNYYLRSYLDPAVCWVGTKNGSWDEATQLQYPEFVGWNSVSENLLGDEDPSNDMTPEQARDLFMWQHRAEGSEALGQTESEYGKKPDWNVDASFGGPVPVIGKYLGNASFFASYRNMGEMFALPTNRDYYLEQNALLKFTSRLSQSMKLSVEGLYGEINTQSRNMTGTSLNDYLTSGDDILWSPLATSYAYDHRGGANLYWPSSLTPFDVYRSMLGISFDHVLSPNTFYSVRVSNTRVKNFAAGPDKLRDNTIIRYFGNVGVDETPYGFDILNEYSMQDGQLLASIGAGARDWSEVNSFSAKFDLTSQVNKYNQVKIGFEYNYDDIHSNYAGVSMYLPSDSYYLDWTAFPYRLGVYAQDKLEFEGLIANIGLRMDYNEPNTDWYDVDRYSKYFQKQYKELFTKEAPTQPAEGHIKLSPRLGVSHPITEDAKLYFNYGHFYSMPRSTQMYEIEYGKSSEGVRFLGNPSALLPKTIAYELGLEYNIADLFLLHLAGYYKDVSDQTGEIQYTNYDGSVDYGTVENNNYADIRGFEMRIDKRFGQWITGWINYNYIVTTSGFIGREHYYQDQRLQRIEGLQNPYQERPIARPFTRVNVQLHTPDTWGPTLAGIQPFGNMHMSWLFSWKAGKYETWDPLETYQLKQNLQWKGQYNFDLRLSKLVRFGISNFELFVDIKNLFNTKYMCEQGFADDIDRLNYLESLHLPQYDAPEYKAQGYTGGDDKPGDVKSDDKPYIDMPNREFLTYLNPRSIFLGIKFDF
ncbi:TonB-dependent receptor [candidate division KSB1 bacterium]|nr:TonB-dependent receptor [candidate division KSB1 bacterium]